MESASERQTPILFKLTISTAGDKWGRLSGDIGLPVMGIKSDINSYLSGNGRVKVNEIANAIGYSHGYTRENAKEMMSNGRINGAKGKQIPAVIVNGNYYVVTGDKSYLLDIVKRHAPSKVSRASGMSVSDLQSLIMNEVADSVVGGPRPWEFWK